MPALTEWENFYVIVGVICWGVDRIVVRCHYSHRRDSDRKSCEKRQQRVCNADHRSLRSCAAAISGIAALALPFIGIHSIDKWQCSAHCFQSCMGLIDSAGRRVTRARALLALVSGNTTACQVKLFRRTLVLYRRRALRRSIGEKQRVGARVR